MTPTSTDAACNVYSQMLAAWNGRDAERFAQLFASDGALIGFDGSTAAGNEIKSHLEPIFRDHPTAAYVAKVREITPLTPSTVLLRSIVGMVPPNSASIDSEKNALQTLVLQRQADRWEIKLLQNTPAAYDGRPELVEGHTKELEEVRESGVTLEGG